tara:strand:+ start:4754 stop:5203 length:450 start_codon:yes stop_codon:yes gene_type:complete
MINFFQEEYRWLSNFWPAQIIYRNITFPTAEHAYQALKADDPEIWEAFAKLSTPGNAKRAGQNLVLRENWEKIKVLLMKELVIRKFAVNNLELRVKLIKTGQEELIEGNWWHDQFWGDCYCPKHKGEPGENHLGKILMAVRKSAQDWTK